MRNTGVTVSLIVFMVLSLILGVTTYIGVRGTSEKKMLVASAKKQTSDAQSANSSMKNELKELKEKVGYPAVDDNKQLIETLATDITSALGATEAAASYRTAVTRLQNNLTRKNVEIADYQSQQNAAEFLADSQDTMTKNQKDEYDSKESTLQKEHQDLIGKAKNSYDDLKSSFDDEDAQLTALKNRTQGEIRDAKQQTADYQEAVGKFQEVNKELSYEVDRLANVLFTRHDAKVVYADQFLKTVRLNVGEKDGLLPLTTFSIYRPSTLNIDDEVAKGSVQVVRCLGDHLCEAKIVEDETSNPISVGDLAYTPLWRPGEVIKYALGFGLDMDGDGLADLDQLMNIIQSSGAEVAYYIDDEGKENGAITTDIYRFVRADDNIYDLLARQKSRSEAARESLMKVEQESIGKAKEYNIPEITLSEFLESIAYRETAKITRYRERGGVDLQDNGISLPTVSDGVVAPSFQLDPDQAPESPGVVAPTYRKDSDKAPESSGKVSDYFFRKRTTSNAN